MRVIRIPQSREKDLALEVLVTQIWLRDPRPFVRSLTAFGMTACLNSSIIMPQSRSESPPRCGQLACQSYPIRALRLANVFLVRFRNNAEAPGTEPKIRLL